MSSENFSVTSAPVTAHPPTARAAEALDRVGDRVGDRAKSQSGAKGTKESAKEGVNEGIREGAKKEGAKESAREDGKNWAEAKAASRLATNQGLLQAMFGKASTRDSNAQKINYQEVVSQLEEVLRKELGDENFSLEKLAAKTSGVEGQEDYWSPEKTADRIVTGATSYFEAFRKQHPDLSEEEALNKFMDIITPAIEKGFHEARTLLEGFEVFKGEVKANAERTLELVYEKLDLFRERLLGSKEDQPLIDDAQGLEE